MKLEQKRLEEEQKKLQMQLKNQAYTYDFNGKIRYIKQIKNEKLPIISSICNFAIDHKKSKTQGKKKRIQNKAHKNPPNRNDILKAETLKVQGAINSTSNIDSTSIFMQTNPSNFEFIRPSLGVTIQEKGKSKSSKETTEKHFGLLSRKEYLLRVNLRRVIHIFLHRILLNLLPLQFLRLDSKK